MILVLFKGPSCTEDLLACVRQLSWQHGHSVNISSVEVDPKNIIQNEDLSS